MLKLEHKVNRGIFLAPKSYLLSTEEGDVMRHKGPAHNYVTPEWFHEQYTDPSKTQSIVTPNPFRINWHTLYIGKKASHVKRSNWY